ncbi:sugar ABC transporter ATP-binding protein [Nakamurella lactea]|uniref:sugar ABC transporter ATP-binding protein n=1 Tax=Nakamurella lactea TaxID=459515 RepID=UPI0003F993B8|nr:sugar ABC transporter ATP-binding protein [Nakamurella lactea]
MTDRDAPEVLIDLRGVSKTFGEQRALDDVGLQIRRGEVHALVGENGSGKSTLIKILAGYYTPDPGSEIRVGGQVLPPGAAAESQRLGLRFVHQSLGLIGEFSAADNIGMVAGYSTGPLGRVRRSEQRRRAGDLLARIGVDVDLDTPVGQLRPVERSAIAIARAVDDRDGEIRLLVLDEPTAALPPTEVEALFRVVRDVASRGVSVLYVSHRLEEILSLADVVSVLRDGQWKGTFPTGELSRESIIEHILGGALAAQERLPGNASRPPTGQSDAVRPALQARGLTARYLTGLDLEVAPGEIVGVAGLDGSGREELAGVLGGAVAAGGEITAADGRTLRRLTARKIRQHGIALVLANWHPASAVREFDVRENITLASLQDFASSGVVRRGREQQAARDWLAAVDVRPPDPGKRYSLLSGGNQQKVIVARWLATRPSVMVLDDPTSGVDVGARAQIYRLLRDQADAGMGVLLCSSDLEDLVVACDRVLCLAGGRQVAEITGSEISESALLTAISTIPDELPGSDGLTTSDEPKTDRSGAA